MPQLDLADLPETGALLGIDPGTKTLGLAISDGLRFTATPLQTLQRSKLKRDLEALFQIYDQRDCVGLIVGLPLNMDGSMGPRAQSVRALVRRILELRDVPPAYQDERLTTAEAERAMIEANLSRARRKVLIDKSAAALILQAALDRLANQ